MAETKRDYRYELIRVLAIILVVGVHTINLLQPDGSNLRQLNINLLSILFSCGNGLFFLMSGKFALQSIVEEKKLGAFYYKKFVFLILPLILYMILYSAIETHENKGSFDGLFKTSILNIVHNYNGYHFWFMYVLVGNILLSPFTARALNGLSKKSLIILCGMGILFNFLFAYTPYLLEVNLAWSYPFSMWTSYFILGGCIDRIITTIKDRKIIISMGIIGLTIIVLKQYIFSYKLFIFDLMPSYTFFVIMVFILLQQISIKSEKVQKTILFLGKRTYGIYLIHFIMIRELLPKLTFLPSNLTGVPYLLTIMVIIFITSLITSYLIDLIIINNIQKGLMILKKQQK